MKLTTEQEDTLVFAADEIESLHSRLMRAINLADSRFHECVSYRDLLRELEWDSDGHCPVCAEAEWDGHADDCRLAKAIGADNG